MINERLALILLNGEIPDSKEPDPHYTKRFYACVKGFAEASFAMCVRGKFKKFEEYLKIALKLFKEGNETVKNAIVNIYLFSISNDLYHKSNLTTYVQKAFPKE